jgi:hypothetical protein
MSAVYLSFISVNISDIFKSVKLGIDERKSLEDECAIHAPRKTGLRTPATGNDSLDSLDKGAAQGIE